MLSIGTAVGVGFIAELIAAGVGGPAAGIGAAAVGTAGGIVAVGCAGRARWRGIWWATLARATGEFCCGALVRSWPIASFRTHALKGRYWRHSGHWSAPGR